MADHDNSVLEDARKRARRRLVGAVVLALGAAVVLPMFLESDPKPLGPDVQIQIPAIDDARFQNRLTPAGAAKGPAADKTAEPAVAEPVPATSAKADTGAVTAPVPAVAATDSTSNKSAVGGVPDVAASKSAAASMPTATSAGQGESKSAPVALAGSLPTTSASGKVTVSNPPAAPAPAASTTATAPVKKAAATAPGPSPVPARAPAAALAAGQATAPASTLPAFSLTATVPPLDAAPAANPKSPSSPAPRAPTAPAAAQGEFVVQLGAFVGLPVAKELAAKAGEQGFPAFLEAVTTKGGQVHRVRVGPFVTRAEADAAAKKLKAVGFTAVTRPRNDAAAR